MGSFLNAVSLRLAGKQPFVNARSVCVKCGHQLSWTDLIPVFSFLVLKGQCRYCKGALSKTYLIVELALLALFIVQGWIWSHSGQGIWHLMLNLTAISVFAFLFLHDLRYYLLPDLVTIPATVFFFVMNLVLGISIKHLLYGIIIGGGFFLAQYLLSKGKWIGDGDIRMGAMLGALFGWPLVLVCLMLSYIAGTLVAIPLLVSGKKGPGEKLPFGTFLALGGLITLWWGDRILSWYLSLL